MPPTLRPFQAKLSRDCYEAWAAGARNVMPVAATGSGKTVVLSQMAYEESGASIAIAHRQELVSQISIALARNGVRHRIVGAKKGSVLVRIITALQVAELGYSFLDPTAKVGAGGVDTVIRMQNEPWFHQVRLMIQDEGHHVLKANKWGRAAQMFPNARGLFPTATPLRADGRGLGRHADGLTDAMVLAPSMRDIINMGYLTDYRVICPPNDFDRSKIEVSAATGDLNQDQVKKAVRASRTITGNVVKHYLRVAAGKLGATFDVDVEEACKTAAEFRAAGVPAEVISSDTPDALRSAIMRRFKNREVLQLVSVDIFGEGWDMPALEVVSFKRPTDSFAVYSQQWGRVLRLMIPDHLQGPGVWDNLGDAGRLAAIAASIKPKGIVIDHVGNFIRHAGPPDQRIVWTLDRREKRAKKESDAIPLRVCVACLQPYEAIYKRCPYCDHYMAPAGRTAPEFVDGDLTELDAATLAAMRGEIARIDGDCYTPAGLPRDAEYAARARHASRQESQRRLRNQIAWWAGVEAWRGHSESESYRRFYYKFGIDVANAQTLGTREAAELASKINLELTKVGVDATVNVISQ